jgi:predicted TIM-barrel fold metal-dependent hydrolase
MSRRLRLALIWTASVLAVLAAGAVVAFHVLVGKPAHAPQEVDVLSPGARALIESAVAEFRGDPAFDHHVHVVGLGASGTGCRANPKFVSWLHPKERIQFLAYQRATGVTDLSVTDTQVAARLVSLAQAAGVSRFGLLAFDAHYGVDGAEHADETEFYVPNTHVERLARENPSLFEPIASVHPYRADAVAELERCAAAGARLVKWLPNAMGMDPADPRCDAFYAAMARLKLTLLTHAGTEHAVESAASQEFGNPLRLRRALDAGVRVFVAHCASLGQGIDLDDPARPSVDNFDLFLRLMDDPRYVGRVFGEISALPQVNRAGRSLETMLARTDLHERLVNGSDYPLPCIDVLFQTGKLAREGYLTAEEAAQLDEIWDVNPLLFDFVLKRTLKHPKTGAKWPASVFRRR